MAIFSCTVCNYAYEFLVSNSYKRHIVRRLDHCPRCVRAREFRIVSVSGMIGRYPDKPEGWPYTPTATLWWRKTHHTGKHVRDPLDEITTEEKK